jgi:hypothetical protein
MRPQVKPASAEQLRLYGQQLREMAPAATDETSRQCLLELATEFDELAEERMRSAPNLAN